MDRRMHVISVVDKWMDEWIDGELMSVIDG
jgi:hypothetical protein